RRRETRTWGRARQRGVFRIESAWSELSPGHNSRSRLRADTRGFASLEKLIGKPQPPSEQITNDQDASWDEPGQRALCRLLSSLVGGYIEAFDEEPLPVAVADRFHQRLLDLAASLDHRATAEHQVADLNRVAACRLWH
ncbi:MAG TPA: hypothetical protein VK620_18840, partial [Bradyrhizobium sp.]|nr:hypothetical protein [Bradyrhizobium sp.]